MFLTFHSHFSRVETVYSHFTVTLYGGSAAAVPHCNLNQIHFNNNNNINFNNNVH